MFDPEIYNPEIMVGDQLLEWRSNDFRGLLVRADGRNYQSAQVLEILWHLAPNVVTLDVVAGYLDTSIAGVTAAVHRAKGCIEKKEHPLHGLVEIENKFGQGYRLVPK